MDNSNITPTPAPTPQPVEPGSNKLVLYFVIGLVIIVLLIGGVYLFMSRQQQTVKNTNMAAVPQPVVQVNPKPQDTVDALDKDLSALNVGTSDTDFSSIDQDLKQL